MTAPQHDVTADPQSIIGALRAERDAALAREAGRAEELAARNTKFGEQIEYQRATIDVLRAMSASTGDPQPVFELIVRHATELCYGDNTALFEFDGGQIHFRANHGGAFDAGVWERYVALFPMAPTSGSITSRAILEKQIIHIRDVGADPEISSAVRSLGHLSQVSIPLMCDGAVIGVISQGGKLGGFTDGQIELLQTFAEQAVIAITSAETYRDLQKALEQQTATAEVLQVINANPGNLVPVFETMLKKAMQLCGAAFGTMHTFDSENFKLETTLGVPPAFAALRLSVFPTNVPGSIFWRLREGETVIHIADVKDDDLYRMGQPGRRALVDLGGARTTLVMALRKDTTLLGAITIFRQEVRTFNDRQIALLQNFAAQAVIAMDNARLITEQREALETQRSTADVLKAISRTTYDLDAVLTMLIVTAARLSASAHGQIWRRHGEVYRYAADHLNVPAYREIQRQAEIKAGRGTLIGRVALEGRAVQIEDAWNDPEYADKEGARLAVARAMLGVPLVRDGELIGAFALARTDPIPFTDREVELVTTFADQAVIAIENVRLFDEVQARTAELARSVSELQALEEVLRAVNSSLDLDIVLATIISRAVQLSQADEGTIYEYDERDEVFVPKAAHGMSEARVAALRDRRIRMGETHLGRAGVTRAPVHVSDVQQDTSMPGIADFLEGIHAVLAVPLLRGDKVIGGLVIRRRTAGDFAPTISALLQNFAGQSVLAIENARLFDQLATREEETRRAREQAEATLADLRRTQDRLVQTEKMASLGQLTAGIAHEIKNPLNFVINFSTLSIDLFAELSEAVAPEKITLAADLRAEIDDLTATLTSNLQKIAEHGRRADSIVKNMLLHSRTGVSERRAVDLNAIAEEALNLAYHGARAETPGFNITMLKNLDPTIGSVVVYPQEIARVLVNLINNGFYAAHRRANKGKEAGFAPTLSLTTRNQGDRVEIRIRDNGTGIPAEVRDKIFEPFFTTKPAGQGTGLGLSLSFGIVVQQHGGQLSVDSEPGVFTEFTVMLPRTSPGNDEAPA